MKKKLLVSLLTLCTLLAFGAAQAADVIKIGLVTPLSAPGDYKSGEINIKTAELAVAELNAKGGVLGKKVVLYKEDDEGKPAVGVTAVKRLITDHQVSAIVGAWHSAVAVAQAKQADKFGVPFLLHYSWTDALTAAHSDYVFRVSPFNSEIAMLLAPFLVQRGYKTVAVLYETTAFGTGFADALAVEAGKRGIKVYKKPFPAEATDLKPQLLDLKAQSPRPELLIVAAVYQAMYLAPKQSYEIGLSPPCEILASWDYPTYPDFWEVVGKNGVGTMYATFNSPKLKLSPLGEHFKKAFTDEYGFSPPIFAYFLYDEFMILADAMERAKSADPKKIAQALRDTDFQGTTGRITFARHEGPVWNQWIGHQLFVKQMTAYKQTDDEAATIYP